MSSLKGSDTVRGGPDAQRLLRKPRICMPSGRNFKKKAWLCGHYEAQDVLAEIDDVDLICLDPGRHYESRARWQLRLMYRDVTRKVVYANPGLCPVRLTGEYDLFLARCQTYKDLLDINAIKGWKDHCRTSVCWIDEMWTARIPEQKYWLHALRQFDHVFIGFHGTIGPLSEAVGRQLHFLPGAVDALRFTPLPDGPERVIDGFSIGRRWEGIHRALLKWAKSKGKFYMYDTFAGSQVEPYDHRPHRDHFAELARRCRFFVVAPGKFDCVDETQGQEEVGHRYFEGAAAGAVMVGQAPKCDAYHDLFPWADAVVELLPDGSDTQEILEQLAADPERLDAISRRNAEQALLHHDWVYRWKEIYRVAGLEPSEGMLAREKELHRLARDAAGTKRAGAYVDVAGS